MGVVTKEDRTVNIGGVFEVGGMFGIGGVVNMGGVLNVGEMVPRTVEARARGERNG